MSVLIFLIPIAIGLGVLGLASFLWSVRSGQYDDLQGAAERILIEDDGPIVDEEESDRAEDDETAGEDPRG